jgi:predicted transcriptional regulator
MQKRWKNPNARKKLISSLKKAKNGEYKLEKLLNFHAQKIAQTLKDIYLTGFLAGRKHETRLVKKGKYVY